MLWVVCFQVAHSWLFLENGHRVSTCHNISQITLYRLLVTVVLNSVLGLVSCFHTQYMCYPQLLFSVCILSNTIYCMVGQASAFVLLYNGRFVPNLHLIYNLKGPCEMVRERSTWYSSW